MSKVLMISTDAKMLEQGTPVRARMIEYGALFDELHIIVFMKGGEKTQLSPNTWVYPTNSISKIFYVRDAIRIGKSILNSSFIITTQDPFETGMVGTSLAQTLKVPLHVQIHTDVHSPYFRNSILNKVRITLAKKSLARAEAVRAVSERIRSSLAPDIQKKTSVLPIFANVEHIRSLGVSSETAGDLHKKYPQFGKIIVMASRLTKEKNIVTALEAFARAIQDVPSAGLVIVGEGPEKEKLKTLAQKLGIGDKVVFENWADHNQLVSYLKSSDVFVSSSLYEGYGLSMLEAYVAGVPIVATDAGIAPLLVNPKALIAPYDSKGMALALKMALGGLIQNQDYIYPYSDKKAYFEAYKKDIERALI